MHDLFLFLRVLRDMLLARVCMHNDFDISLVVRREALTITLSMEATSEDVKIVQFYSFTLDKVQHTVRMDVACISVTWCP